jgi:hypothetical protein
MADFVLLASNGVVYLNLRAGVRASARTKHQVLSCVPTVGTTLIEVSRS